MRASRCISFAERKCDGVTVDAEMLAPKNRRSMVARRWDHGNVTRRLEHEVGARGLEGVAYASAVSSISRALVSASLDLLEVDSTVAVRSSEASDCSSSWLRSCQVTSVHARRSERVEGVY